MAGSEGDILVNVTFAISRADFITGWVFPNPQDDAQPAKELGASVRARLDEIYGDDGGAYAPDVLSIAVGGHAISPADLRVALVTATTMLDGLDAEEADEAFGLTLDDVYAVHQRLDKILSSMVPGGPIR